MANMRKEIDVEGIWKDQDLAGVGGANLRFERVQSGRVAGRKTGRLQTVVQNTQSGKSGKSETSRL